MVATTIATNTIFFFVVGAIRMVDYVSFWAPNEHKSTVVRR